MSTTTKLRVADERDERLSSQTHASIWILAHLDTILPPMDSAHVAALAASMREQGYFEHEPIVKYRLPGITHDSAEVTIIGRHREAAAAEAEVEPAVEYFRGDPIEAVFRMVASVTRHRYLSGTQLAAVQNALAGAGYDWDQVAVDRGFRVSKDQIEGTLLEQAGLERPLSHRAIARMMHMEWSRLRIDRACARLVANGSLNQCPHRFTETGSEAPGRKTQVRRDKEQRGTPPPAKRQPPAPEPPEPVRPLPTPPAPPEPEVPSGVGPAAGSSKQAAGSVAPVRIQPADEQFAALDDAIRARLITGTPTNFRELAERFGLGKSAVQNRIQWNMGFLAAQANDPACTHSCPVHCP